MLLPDGKYSPARAHSWGLGKTGTGKEQIGIEFEIQAGEYIGRSATWYGYFTPDTYERTIKTLRTCGWQGTDLEDLNGLDGNDVELDIATETFEGKDRNKVKWVNKPGGLAMKEQLDPGSAKAFAAKMKGAIVALDKATGRKAAAPKKQREEPPPHTDSDDIPF